MLLGAPTDRRTTEAAAMTDIGSSKKNTDAKDGIPVKVVDRRSKALRRAAGDASTPAAGMIDAEAKGGTTPESSAPDSRRYPSYVEELQARLEEAEQRARDVLSAHQKVQSEQEEFRRRLSRDVKRRVDAELGNAFSGLLEVLDDMDRALQHAEESASEAAGFQALIDGIRLVRERFLSVMCRLGVERLETAGKPFDPNNAEAIQVVDVDEPSQKDIVLDEIRPGYTFKGEVLRPARVRVGRLR
jgi:molecular chaperone GrpE